MTGEQPDEAPGASEVQASTVPQSDQQDNSQPTSSLQEPLENVRYDYEVKEKWWLPPSFKINKGTMDPVLTRCTKTVNRPLTQPEVAALVEYMEKNVTLFGPIVTCSVGMSSLQVWRTWDECRYPFKSQRLLNRFGWSFDGFNITRYYNPVLSGRATPLLVHAPRILLYQYLWFRGTKWAVDVAAYGLLVKDSRMTGYWATAVHEVSKKTL